MNTRRQAEDARTFLGTAYKSLGAYHDYAELPGNDKQEAARVALFYAERGVVLIRELIEPPTLDLDDSSGDYVALEGCVSIPHPHEAAR